MGNAVIRNANAFGGLRLTMDWNGMQRDSSLERPKQAGANRIPSSVGRSRRDGPLRVAIVHDRLTDMGTPEQVLESLLRLFPDAEIFTHVLDADAISQAIAAQRIHTTSIARLPFARRLFRNYVPLMPRALTEIDLSGFDLVISSERAPAKGIRVPPGALHLCYCHSTMSHVWAERSAPNPSAGLVMERLTARNTAALKAWDIESAANVHVALASSTQVQQQIRNRWQRDAEVLHPPVAVRDYAPVPAEARGSYYLWAGDLRASRNPEMTIRAFNTLDLPLIVIGGSHAEERRMARFSRENIRFLGDVPPEKRRRYFACAKALVMPWAEPFATAPVESMAAGRPVIAYAGGGALDVVRDHHNGLLFEELSQTALMNAVQTFEGAGLEHLPVNNMLLTAGQFDEPRFHAAILAQLEWHGLCPPRAASAAN